MSELKRGRPPGTGPHSFISPVLQALFTPVPLPPITGGDGLVGMYERMGEDMLRKVIRHMRTNQPEQLTPTQFGFLINDSRGEIQVYIFSRATIIGGTSTLYAAIHHKTLCWCLRLRSATMWCWNKQPALDELISRMSHYLDELRLIHTSKDAEVHEGLDTTPPMWVVCLEHVEAQPLPDGSSASVKRGVQLSVRAASEDLAIWRAEELALAKGYVQARAFSVTLHPMGA